jgi:hypothetical protein
MVIDQNTPKTIVMYETGVRLDTAIRRCSLEAVRSLGSTCGWLSECLRDPFFGSMAGL